MNDFDKSIALHSDYSTPYYNRANLIAAMGRYPEAFQDYDKSIELNVKDPIGFYNRGVAFLMMDRKDQALEVFDTVVELDPVFAWPMLTGGLYIITKESMEWRSWLLTILSG